MHDLAAMASATGHFPKGIKATPANAIERMEKVFSLIRALPEDTIMGCISQFGFHIDEATFNKVFAGCEVTETKEERSVFCDSVQVSCWRESRDPEPDPPKRWTRTLPQFEASA